jgi:ribonuclease HIII
MVGRMGLKSYTSPLTSAQAAALGQLMRQEGFVFAERPYTLAFGQKGHLTVAIYEKGPKVVVQGRDTEDFVKFRLEPEILGEAKLGYEEELQPEQFSPHFGIDESGKGDFFGPIVISGAYVDRGLARAMREAGVADSKRITSDARIREIAGKIRALPGSVHDVVLVGPEAYNKMIAKMGSVNRLLAWGHARVLENLLAKRPDCPRALSDQFADPALLRRALLEKGRTIQFDTATKAESDPAVAAASILAREAFIDWMDRTSRAQGVRLPRGASAEVKRVARELVAAGGAAVLERLAKTHFRTAHEVAPADFPEPAPKTPWKSGGQRRSPTPKDA